MIKSTTTALISLVQGSLLCNAEFSYFEFYVAWMETFVQANANDFKWERF